MSENYKWCSIDFFLDNQKEINKIKKDFYKNGSSENVFYLRSQATILGFYFIAEICSYIIEFEKNKNHNDHLKLLTKLYKLLMTAYEQKIGITDDKNDKKL